jgi:hypothetical protein
LFPTRQDATIAGVIRVTFAKQAYRATGTRFIGFAMPSPLKADDHYVLVKLCNELLPWMIGGQRARKQWFVHVAEIYGYGGEIFSALAGLGLGAPLIALFQGKNDGKDALTILQQALPGIWFWIGVVALAAWIILRIVVNRKQVVERALFAKDCSKSMEKLYSELYQALATRDAIAKLAPIQAAVMKRVDEAIDKSVWPWSPPPPPDGDVALELAAKVDDIRSRFMGGWDPPPRG